MPEDLKMHPALVKYASGLLFIPFGPANQHHYALLARNEQVEEITWAGKASDPEEDNELSPRVSFAHWKQEVRGQAVSWDDAELDMARQLGHQLGD